MAERVTLAAVGDLMLTHPVSEGSDPAVWAALREADLVFANLEAPMTDRGYPADKTVAFRTSPALAPELPRLGIDVVTIANNHALDYGHEGLLHTLELVREEGVAIVGGGRNRLEALAPSIVASKGLTVAFVGLASTLPPGYAASDSRPGIAPVRVASQFVIDGAALEEQPGMAPLVKTWALEDDTQAACEAVRRAKAQADVVVVGIHWGVPNGWVAQSQDVLADYQRPLGQALIEAGASLIIGTHPHCLHGIEQYKGGWIAYSLGNFLFHSLAVGGGLEFSRPYPVYKLESLMNREARESCILKAELTAEGVAALTLTPIYTDDAGEPVRLHGSEAAVVLARMNRLSRPLGVEVTSEGVVVG